LFDGILSGVAGVINGIAGKIPSISGIPWDKIMTAGANFTAAITIWMDAFPFIYDILIVSGLMLLVGIGKITFFWISFLIKKIPFIS